MSTKILQLLSKQTVSARHQLLNYSLSPQSFSQVIFGAEHFPDTLSRERYAYSNNSNLKLLANTRTK